MTRRQLKTDDEEGFLRAFKDEILDAQADYQVDIRVGVVVRPERPGVTFVASVFSVAPDATGEPLMLVEQPYPTHSASRLHAGLYRLAISISVALSRDYERKTGLIHPLAAESTRKG